MIHTLSVARPTPLRQYADRRIFDVERMESFRRFDPESLAASESEMLSLLALAGLVRLLQPYIVRSLARSNPVLGLTPRESDVLGCVAAGGTNAQTAELLSIAPGTVKKHLDHIYEKLGVSTRTEAAVTAMGIAMASRPGDHRQRVKW